LTGQQQQQQPKYKKGVGLVTLLLVLGLTVALSY
jgi:hypothetical protein